MLPPNNALVSDVCAAALRAFYNAPQRGRWASQAAFCAVLDKEVPMANSVRAHGSMDVGLPAGPNFFLFSDPEHSAKALLAAGFVSPSEHC